MTKKEIKEIAETMYQFMKDDLVQAQKEAVHESMKLQEDFIETKEAAAFLKMHPDELRRNIKDIPHYQMHDRGRHLFLRSELSMYIRQSI